MRIAVVAIVLAWCAGLALAKPKVAVLPLANDDDGKVALIVAEAAAKHAVVASAKVVGRALASLAIDDPDNAAAAKRIRARMKLDAVIYGKVVRDGAKKKLKLSIYTRGKKPAKFEVDYAKSSSKAFHKELDDELGDRLDPDEREKDDDDGETARDVKRSDRDDDRPAVHKRHRDEEAESAHAALTQPDVFAAFGGGPLHRSLTYAPRSGNIPPPPVGTIAGAAQIGAELYGSASDSLASVASFGIYASLQRTAALSIAIPGAPQSAPIKEGLYQLGVRYRYRFGQSSIAFGASYWNQFFIADRSPLTGPTQLNMADTDYQAFAPGVLLRLAASPTVAIALQADVPLMIGSGQLTDSMHYGAASSIAFVLQANLDIALGPHYGLHVGALVDQVNVTFKGGSLSTATDRSIGAVAALAVMY